MKLLQAVVLAIALAVATSAVFAQTKEEHEAHHPDANTNTQAAPDTDMKDEGQMPAMKATQKNMKIMHELMEKIHSSTNPDEKAKLLKQHMQTMRDQMKAMRGMGGGGMGTMQGDSAAPGGKKDADAMAMMCGDKKGARSSDMMGSMMMKCHRMMQARMDMMQEMMAQLLEHEEAEQELEHGK